MVVMHAIALVLHCSVCILMYKILSRNDFILPIVFIFNPLAVKQNFNLNKKKDDNAFIQK